MSTPPLVSILMPVRDGMRFLPAAVQSVLQQSFSNWELIVVDDGSTDGSAEYVEGLADQRVRLLRMGARAGITVALQRGWSEASGEFLARFDADDVMLPRRLERQLQVMLAQPELGVLGCQWREIDEHDKPGGVSNFPLSDAEVRLYGCWNSPFAHPGVMLRLAELKARGVRGYNPDFAVAQDYALWADCLEVMKGANLPEVLISYRRHGHSISGQKAEEQRAARLRMGQVFLRRLLEDLAVEDDAPALQAAMLGQGDGLARCVQHFRSFIKRQGRASAACKLLAMKLAKANVRRLGVWGCWTTLRCLGDWRLGWWLLRLSLSKVLRR